MLDVNQHRPKAYSYLRFSTPEQAKGDSQRRQMDAAKRYALEHSLDLVDASYEDLGVSAFRGANAETGMLGEFCDAVRSGNVPKGSWLLIESLDRLSRNRPRKAVRLLESICEEGITLVTLSDGKIYTEALLDDDPMAFMWAFMVAMRANEESETKSRRLRAAWSQKRKVAAHKKLTAKAPSWLRLSEDRMGFHIDECRANVVRRIYQMSAEGAGYGKIAEILNREGVPTFAGGQMWHRSFITKLLNAQTAIGIYTPSVLEHIDGKKQRRPTEQIKDYYPAIITEDLNALVKARLSVTSPRGRHANSGVTQNILANLCSCSRCGASVTLVGKGPKDVKRLVCSKAKAGAGCTYNSIPYPEIEYTLVAQRDVWLLLDLEEGHPLSATIDALSEEIEATKTKIGELFGLHSTMARGELERLDANLVSLEREYYKKLEVMEQTMPASVSMKAEQVREELARDQIDRTKVNGILKQVLTKAIVGFDDGLVHLHWRHGAETTVRFRWGKSEPEHLQIEN